MKLPIRDTLTTAPRSETFRALAWWMFALLVVVAWLALLVWLGTPVFE